jgi:hypothetical protein
MQRYKALDMEAVDGGRKRGKKPRESRKYKKSRTNKYKKSKKSKKHRNNFYQKSCFL